MAYSTIERKKCKCSPICDKWPTLSCYGYNYAHLPENLKEKAGTKRRVAQKNKNIRNAIMVKAKKQDRLLNGDTALDLWFFVKMHTSEKKCENCGADLHHYDEWTWRGSQHHIVEKALCPSVATNPENHLVLGYWCCHSQWHTSWFNASKMPVFQKARDKYQLFKNDIAEGERKKVNPYLQTVSEWPVIA